MKKGNEGMKKGKEGMKKEWREGEANKGEIEREGVYCITHCPT